MNTNDLSDHNTANQPAELCFCGHFHDNLPKISPNMPLEFLMTIFCPKNVTPMLETNIRNHCTACIVQIGTISAPGASDGESYVISDHFSAKNVF